MSKIISFEEAIEASFSHVMLKKILTKVSVHFDSRDCCDDALQAFSLGERGLYLRELELTQFTHEQRNSALCRTPCCRRHGDMIAKGVISNGETFLDRPISAIVDLSSLGEAEKTIFMARYSLYFKAMAELSVLSVEFRMLKKDQLP